MYKRQAAYYVPLVDGTGAITYRKEGSDTQMSYSDGDFGKARDWYMELALNYNRKFGDHNVSALALYNQSKNIILEVIILIFRQDMLVWWAV